MIKITYFQAAIAGLLTTFLYLGRPLEVLSPSPPPPEINELVRVGPFNAEETHQPKNHGVIFREVDGQGKVFWPDYLFNRSPDYHDLVATKQPPTAIFMRIEKNGAELRPWVIEANSKEYLSYGTAVRYYNNEIETRSGLRKLSLFLGMVLAISLARNFFKQL